MPNWYTKIKEVEAGKLRDFMKGVGVSTMMAGPALFDVHGKPLPQPTPIVAPATQPTSQPASTQPVAQPATQPTSQPSSQPATKPAVKIDINKIIFIESSGRANAVSGKGASGLMQVMPATWGEIVNKLGHGRDPAWTFEKGKFDREKNIAVGGYYMNVEIPRLLKSFGVPDTVETRLAAYNWGIKGVKDAYSKLGDQWLTAAPMETQSYVRKYISR